MTEAQPLDFDEGAKMLGLKVLSMEENNVAVLGVSSIDNQPMRRWMVFTIPSEWDTMTEQEIVTKFFGGVQHRQRSEMTVQFNDQEGS